MRRRRLREARRPSAAPPNASRPSGERRRRRASSRRRRRRSRRGRSEKLNADGVAQRNQHPAEAAELLAHFERAPLSPATLLAGRLRLDPAALGLATISPHLDVREVGERALHLPEQVWLVAGDHQYVADVAVHGFHPTRERLPAGTKNDGGLAPNAAQ